MLSGFALIVSCNELNLPIDPALSGSGGNSFAQVESLSSEKDNDGKGWYVVFLKKGADNAKIKDLFKQNNIHIHRELDFLNAIAIDLPLQASDKALAALQNHFDVDFVEPDYLASVNKPGKNPPGKNPPAVVPQSIPWGITKVWDSFSFSSATFTSNVVKVGVVDTGIDLDHPDLQDNIFGNVTFAARSKSGDDDNGHGTHVAGTIAALDNSIGVVGVAPTSHLYAVKVLDRRGSGRYSDVAVGINWCINNNIDIINMSLGGASTNTTLQSACDLAAAAGVLVVCAAGNDGQANVSYPAKYSSTVAVSAMTEQETLAYFSNYGSEIDLTAPGTNINSTYKDGGYTVFQGTSMASPHVAGVAALIKMKYPGISLANFKTALFNAVDLGWTADKQGNGLVNAPLALN